MSKGYLTRLPISIVMLMGLGSAMAFGQNYPTRPIRILTSEPGGGNDLQARIIGQGITGPLEQPVIVDNRGSVGFELAAKAAPDGYTLLLAGPSFWIGPLLRKLPYDPVKDFAPITLLARAPNLLVVNASVGAKTVKELIALAKAKPGELNYASSVIGGANHLPVELFKSMAGVNIIAIQYKGTGFAINALIGNEVQMMISTAGSAAPHVKSGRLKALALTSAEPSTLYPDLPTIAASGVPGYESVTLTGIFAPAKTPVTVIRKLNEESVRAISETSTKKQLFNAGVEVIAGSPQELAAAVRTDMTRMGKVIKDADIRVQ